MGKNISYCEFITNTTNYQISLENKCLSGEIKMLKSNGHPRKLSKQDQNWIRVKLDTQNRGLVLRDITSKLSESRNANISVHPRTVQRFLCDHNLKQRIIRKKWPLPRSTNICCLVFRKMKSAYLLELCYTFC